MREIVLDTETTGLDTNGGDRVVEIACLELVHHVPTGETFRRYINPQCAMPEEAFRIHGLSDDFLADQPTFAEVVDDFLAFIADSPLVIHNAEFDLGFINAELGRLGRDRLDAARAVDTMRLARKRFPGAQASLDALCRRFEIDNSARTFHGALLDCELLADVYLELKGGRQPGFELAHQGRRRAQPASQERPPRPLRPHAPSAEELAAHERLLEGLENPIWRQ